MKLPSMFESLNAFTFLVHLRAKDWHYNIKNNKNHNGFSCCMRMQSWKWYMCVCVYICIYSNT